MGCQYRYYGDGLGYFGMGFQVDVSAFALPLLAFGILLIFSQKSSRKSVGEFIFGFSFLFKGLSMLQANAPDLEKNPEMLAFVQNYTDMGFGSVLLFVLIGTVLTMVVQASSATMAITLIMCANGWISFELGACLGVGRKHRYDHYGQSGGSDRQYAGTTGCLGSFGVQRVRCHLGVVCVSVLYGGGIVVRGECNGA